ncbi:hypothetical protein GCM10018785_05470 [Streptomyces longispororuber]|uniref:Uncharacterized protein n=1 Tax=Streptomyces longispororuber TaxID=68230 RepID=A0A918Z761_9ACTN|nr:hypothetical protein GCM10018785_05470 [Streptomyces longispororuber]
MATSATPSICGPTARLNAFTASPAATAPAAIARGLTLGDETPAKVAQRAVGGALEAAQAQLGGGQARAPAGVVRADEADQLAETQGHGAHLPSCVVVSAARLP